MILILILIILLLLLIIIIKYLQPAHCAVLQTPINIENITG